MIETERLFLKPLSYSELRKQIDSPATLAEEMGFTPSSSLMNTDVKQAIQHDLLPLLADANNDSLFYTLWLIIEKNKRTILGGFCFHGEPDIEGEVEIGYGIDDTFRNHGYMTEAINAIIQWAKDHTMIKTIKAETDTTNRSSIRVLTKNHFSMTDQSDLLVIMKYSLKQ